MRVFMRTVMMWCAAMVVGMIPAFAGAQQDVTCEQRVAVLGQLVEDMARARSTVNNAEVEAASLKVELKNLRNQVQAQTVEIEKLKTSTDKK